jgi:hypothetical protein
MKQDATNATNTLLKDKNTGVCAAAAAAAATAAATER